MHNKPDCNKYLNIHGLRTYPVCFTSNNQFYNFRFAHLKAGSEALSDASSVTSSLLSSSYDEPLTMRKRKNSKLCSGFVAKNIAAAGTGRKGCSLTEEEDERANQIVSEDPMMVDGIWSKIER